MKRLLVVLTALLLLVGCAPGSPATQSNEPLYFKGDVFTWNGTAYQLVNTNLGGSGSGVQNGDAVSFSSITDTGLTQWRLVTVGAGGLLNDNANLTYSGGKLNTNALSLGVTTGKVLVAGIGVQGTVDGSTNMTFDLATGLLTANISGLDTSLAGKQDTLVSGTNIKTINGSTLLGAGDLVISAGAETDPIFSAHASTNVTSASLAFWDSRGTSNVTLPITTGNVTGLDTALAGKEPTITGGLASQFWSGIKTWVTLIFPQQSTATANNFLTGYDNTTGAWTKAQPTWANIDKTTSDIANITTRSHTSLSDIGTNSHATVDTFIASKGAANGLAPLGAASTVPPANLGAGSAVVTNFLNGTGNWSAPTASAAWGSITGTLASQTDLQNQLVTMNATIATKLTSITSQNVTDALGYIPTNNATRDVSGGFPGLTLLKINFKNVANTFTSFFTNSNTAARTYTFQNRDGTIADDTDITAQIPDAIGTTKGDVISFSSASTPVRVASTAVNGDVLVVDTAQASGLKFATPAGGSTPLFARMTANSATTSTTLVEIDNLYVTLNANSVYRIEAGWNETVSAVTTGIRFGASYNGTLTAMELQFAGSLLNTTAAIGRVSANNTATTALFVTTSASTAASVMVTGIVVTGANGGTRNFSLKQLKVTSGTATALANGWLMATKVN